MDAIELHERYSALGPVWRKPYKIFPYECGSFLLSITIALILLMSLQGCATLPDTRAAVEGKQTRHVYFKGIRGRISKTKSDAILNQLKGDGSSDDILKKQLLYEQAVNIDSPLVLGNKLRLLQNGPDTYEAMFTAIRSAKNTINLETYIFDNSQTGSLFFDLLLEKQKAGVQVNVIYDSIGSLSTPQKNWDILQSAGAKVIEFNPINPLKTYRKKWRLNNRDHRRQLIIDGRIAFTGGINISDSYSSAPSSRHSRKKNKALAADENPKPKIGWRDTHIRIEGPVVAEFQKLFMETWTRQKGEPLVDKHYFPELKTEGKEIVRAIGSTPSDPRSPIYLTLISAIRHSQRSVHLTIAYFAPDHQLLRALIEAAQRGVDVQLLLPSHTDSWAIFNLGHSYYTKLLKSGVTINERHGAVMHAKTACIDGVWSTIGSTNMDWRSFLHNDEINAVILGQDFATQMEVMFADDLQESNAISLEKWRQRPWLQRLKERTARLGAYWL